jgi:hypothetical protein
MQSPMWEKKSSSNKVGGGDIGVIVGIVQDTMTGDGVIIRVIQAGIEGYLMTGEITIETICGTDDLGIIILFITVTWIDIGEAVIGEMIMDGDILVGMVEDLVGMAAVPVLVVVLVDTVEDLVDTVAVLVINTQNN